MFGFVLRHSKRDQLYLLALIVASYPIQFLVYDSTKVIINKAIGGKGPPFEASFFGLIKFSLDVDQITFLLSLCFVYLFAVIASNGFKNWINNVRGRNAEKLVRRLRYLLYTRILRFPQPQFKRTSQGELIAMVTGEVEQVGNFFPGAIADPVFLGGQLAVSTMFILAQDWMMGLIAFAVFPIQMYVIPKMQKKVSALSKRRQREVRRLSDHLGETVTGIIEVHANDTSGLERARLAERLGVIYTIRLEIFSRKYAIKALNNLLDKVSPFFFYSIGGILVIQGDITLGGLVAVIGAQKDMAAPWKELLNWYQAQADATVKYEQVIAQFEPPGLLDQALLDAHRDEAVPPLAGPVRLATVSLVDEDGIRRVAGVSTEFTLAEHVAVTGGPTSGKDDLARLLARLAVPTSGRISVGGQDLATLPEAVTGRRIGWVDQMSTLQSATVRENLLYALKQRPIREPAYTPEEAAARANEAAAARLAGNTTQDYNADWVDYAAAGASGPDDIVPRLIEVLGLVELTDDIYQMGLRGTIDPSERPDIAAAALRARAALADRLADPAYAGLVERFDPERYNANATMAENLLFGTPTGTAFKIETLAQNARVRSVLDKVGLTDELVEAGREVAQTMVDIFADLPPGHEFFERYSFISSDELPEFRTLLGRVGSLTPTAMSAADRSRLLALPFMVIPARHRLGVVTPEREARLIEARRIFRAELPDDLAGEVEFFDPARYNAAASLQDNILFGKVAHGAAQAGQKIGALVVEMLEVMDLRGTVMEAGLGYHVGVGGSRLSSTQRQKLAFARSLLRQPDLLVVNEAGSAFDTALLTRLVRRLLAERAGKAVVWAVSRPQLAETFGRVLVMDDGQIVEDGSWNTLNREGTRLHALLNAA
ncbi:MAG: ABC transporter ATP-binding protein [Alphaproteobacteria bacterium]|nr:ABC transporter ATP-binding protein [Alphaproteobacteria bacterium]